MLIEYLSREVNTLVSLSIEAIDYHRDVRDLKNTAEAHKTATFLIFGAPGVLTRKPACLWCTEFLRNTRALLRCYTGNLDCWFHSISRPPTPWFHVRSEHAHELVNCYQDKVIELHTPHRVNSEICMGITKNRDAAFQSATAMSIN